MYFHSLKLFPSLALILCLLARPVLADVSINGNKYSTPVLDTIPYVSMQFTIRSLTATEQQGSGFVRGAAQVVVTDARPKAQRTFRTFVGMEFGSRLRTDRRRERYPYGYVSEGFDGGCARFGEPVRVQHSTKADTYVFETSSFLGGDLENKNPVFDGVRDTTYGPRAIQFANEDPDLIGGRYYEFRDDQNVEFDSLMEHVIAANKAAEDN